MIARNRQVGNDGNEQKYYLGNPSKDSEKERGPGLANPKL